MNLIDSLFPQKSPKERLEILHKYELATTGKIENENKDEGDRIKKDRERLNLLLLGQKQKNGGEQ